MKIDLEALEGALCALADHEGLLEDACHDLGLARSAMHDVCAALRHIVDDDFRPHDDPLVETARARHERINRAGDDKRELHAPRKRERT